MLTDFENYFFNNQWFCVEKYPFPDPLCTAVDAVEGGYMSEKDKRKKFCCLYAVLGDAEEAAIRAGFDRENALDEAAACLKSKSCRNSVKAMRELLSDSGSVISGLRRLAFGNCADGILLAFSDEPPTAESLQGLDLFNVAEIKRVRGGGVEIKMFDRLKALEKLYELECELADRGRASALAEALAKSAGEDFGDDL